MTKHNKAQHSTHGATHVEHAPQRTTLQTIALVYVILHGIIWTIATISLPGEDAPLVVALLVLASIASIVAGIGLWLWKRWGIYLYIVSVVVVAVLAFVGSGGSMIMLFGALLPPIIVAYILRPALEHFK